MGWGGRMRVFVMQKSKRLMRIDKAKYFRPILGASAQDSHELMKTCMIKCNRVPLNHYPASALVVVGLVSILGNKKQHVRSQDSLLAVSSMAL